MSNFNTDDDLILRISAFAYQMIAASQSEPGNVFVAGYTHAMRDLLTIIEGIPATPLPPEAGFDE